MKKAAIALAIVALIAAGAIFWVYYSLDMIVKVALEHYGPDVLGVPVKVSGVRISPKTGEGSLAGVEIGNPQGFAAARAVKLGEIRVSIDPLTLTEPVISIRELAVDAPLITFERGRGGNNLDAIQKHIDAYVRRSSGDGGDPKAAAQSAGARRFVVEKLSIRGAKVTMTNAALRGQGITFDLPDVQLRDIGKREKGLRASELANVVARELISRIAQRVLTNIDLLRKGGVEGAVDALKGLLK